MEPPTTVPRRAATLSRLWRTTDVADCIGSYLPTKSLAVLPTVAQQFERDKWRSLVAALRQQPRRAVAECTGALLSALQMGGRDSYHFREDWADQARFSEKWTTLVFRRAVAGPGETEPVDYTAAVSAGTLVLDRITPRNSTNVMCGYDIARVSDRCCVHRFRVALTYTPNNEVTTSCGSGFQLANTENVNNGFKGLFIIYVAYENSSFQLRWKTGNNDYTLKIVPTRHTFLVDATLDWHTATARVRVNGADILWPVPFRRLPVTTVSLKCGEHPGQHTFGPVDVWYSNTPPPQPPSSVRFEGDP